VIFESPAGKGFGAAALTLRPLFKLKPRQGPDGPEAATLNIAIAFRAGEMHSNLSEIQKASVAGVAPEGSMDPTQNVGHHEINGRNLVVTGVPLEMRRLTMLTEPQWAAAPSFDDLAKAYPAEAAGIEGYAVAHCRVDAAGVLSRCVVAKETPAKRGFGKAAVALTAKFRVSPEAMAKAPHGAPVEVDVPVRFPALSEGADHVVRNPVWIPGADPETLIAELPPGLGKPNSPGAQVGCRVGADGALTGCAIELTSPDGFDFDQAAVRLAARLKMNLWSGDAGPVEGGIVHLPVRLGIAQQAQR
jgi:TonB family protein